MGMIPQRPLPRAVLATGLALLPAGGTYATLEQIPGVDENQRGPHIEACAQQLGQHATQVARLPGACEPFRVSFVHEGRTVYVTDPAQNGPGSSVGIHSEYKLPAAGDFPVMAEEWNDQEEAQFDRGVAYLAATLELGGTVGLFLAMSATIRQRRREEREPDGPAVAAA